MEYEKDIRIRTKKFAVSTIKLTKELKKHNVDYPLVRQILRSGTSIGANVREGKQAVREKS